MENKIIIKQSYFDNIKAAIDALNQFCESGFKVKNFPILDNGDELEPIVEKILNRLNSVDVAWLEDEQKMSETIEAVNEELSHINPVDGMYETIVSSNNTAMLQSIDAYLGFKTLQLIADNFQDFMKFINGIYTFQIYTNPSQYTDVLDIFGKSIALSEMPDLDIDDSIFNDAEYVEGLYKNDLIVMADELNADEEIERIVSRTDLQGVEILVDDTVQEAAEINYFDNYKPAHMKYSEKSGKWIVSKQFTDEINKLVAGLRKCDTVDDLKKFFNSTSIANPNVLADTTIPFILAKAFTNKKKYDGSYNKDKMDRYIDSYNSILKQNAGARRFQNYDIFSTFRTDKEGTIKFIEDFLKLNLINDENASISNNTLLNIFNIFDSRIYLDIAYYVQPDTKKQANNTDEDAFVKKIRAKINKNSRSKSAYDMKDVANGDNPNAPQTTETIKEYVGSVIDSFGSIDISTITMCEHFIDAVHSEIDTMNDAMFNVGLSNVVVEEFIGESFNDCNIYNEYDVVKRRETVRSVVNSIVDEMEEIVKLDNRGTWNNNKLVSRYKTFAGLFCPLFPGIHGSTENHVDIKQAHKYLNKAIKGKAGNYTPEQQKALSQLLNYVDNLWASVKLFWLNPLNWPKRLNILLNDRKQNVTRNIARIAHNIVDMKQSLEFVNGNAFIEEFAFEEFEPAVYQEASTVDNRKYLAKSLNILIDDLEELVKLDKENKYSDNIIRQRYTPLMSMTKRTRSENYVTLVQAIKYVGRAISGVAGSMSDGEISTLKTLLTHLKDMRKAIHNVWLNPGSGDIFGSVKTHKPAEKFMILAKQVVAMKDELKFINDEPTKDSSDESTDGTISESYLDINAFKLYMEAGPVHKGEIPEYMKTRLKMSDNLTTSVTPTELPAGVPTNPVSDLTDSIDAKVKAGDDSDLDTVLGSGAKSDGKSVVINITNNYTNSFNKDSNNTSTVTNDDHSTGKTITKNETNTDSKNNANSGNDNSHHNRADSSANKSTHQSTENHKNSHNRSDKKNTINEANNNNNSSGSNDTKDSISSRDGEQKLSNGKTIQEMFMFLESKEPQSGVPDAKPPKEDLLTKAMDNDRRTLSGHQKLKKGITKAGNTVRAGLKPVSRVKQWLTRVVDSLIAKDQDSVKAQLLEDGAYRSTVFKASRLALKLGLAGVAFTIQPYLGAAYVGIQALKLADKPRLKREMAREIETELEIVNDKIHELDRLGNHEEKYRYMRMKKDLEKYLTKTPYKVIKSPKDEF